MAVEEDEEWTVLSMDYDKLSQEDPSSPIKDESGEIHQSIPDDAQGIPTVAQDMTNHDANATSTDTTLTAEQDDTPVLSRRFVATKAAQKETMRFKECNTSQKPYWEFNPCNVAIIVGIGCVGLLAFLSFK